MNKDFKKPNKVLLIIRDGWGYSSDIEYNMIAQANTPYTDYLEENYPTTLLKASGKEVGLPDGYFGNSEVGHMTIGSGRILEQSLLRINNSISNGSFFENKEFLKVINFVKKNNSKLHLIGLLQKEGVHANFNHTVALLELLKKHDLKNDDVQVHVITDGRDSKKQNAKNYLEDLKKEISRIGVGKISTLSGRHFAMDRNQNWDRTEKYYQILMAEKKSENFSDPLKYLEEKYLDENFSDEFLEPVFEKNYLGISEGDGIIFSNFRKDRARQLTKVFDEKDFSKFETHHKNNCFISMTRYYDNLKNVAFSDLIIEHTLGEILELNKKTQLRISETEKYAHVTFFFDAGIDINFVGEKKILIPSPCVKTFDKKPEMSSREIAEMLISSVNDVKYDFILCNFPNADMVGHSGNHRAIKVGIEAVDKALEEIIPVFLKNRYVIMLTADHGNAEYKHETYETSHTNNLVPFTIISDYSKYKNLDLLKNLGLKNILSTILSIFDIKPNNIHDRALF